MAETLARRRPCLNGRLFALDFNAGLMPVGGFWPKNEPAIAGVVLSAMVPRRIE
jgi:hypothetical protein